MFCKPVIVFGGPLFLLSMVVSAQAHGIDAPASSVTTGPAVDCRAEKTEAERVRSEAPVATREDGRQVLARERFITGDVHGALDIWNDVGQPRVQCINVDGLVRTRRSVVIDHLDMTSGELLTSEKLERMERRLDELPITSRSRVRYDPMSSGSATVTAIVAERNVVPRGLNALGAVGARAIFLQEIRVDVAGPTGRGEVWSPAYRVSRNRPRVMLRLQAPAPGKLPGILRLQTFLERQTYQYETLGDGVFSERRQRVGAALSDWVTSWLRWEGGAAFDRIAEVPYVAVEGSVNARALGDRLAVILTAGRWAATDRGAPFSNGELVATVRSTARQDVPVFTTLIGVASATDSASLAIWPGASSGEGRGAFLRAHPLRRSSVITGDVFGRQLVFTTSEYEHPISTRVGRVGIAGFIDAARASRRLDPGTSTFHVDVGGGVRYNASSAGKVRLDVGYGVRDGRVRISAGYVLPWGMR